MGVVAPQAVQVGALALSIVQLLQFVGHDTGLACQDVKSADNSAGMIIRERERLDCRPIKNSSGAEAARRSSGQWHRFLVGGLVQPGAQNCFRADQLTNLVRHVADHGRYRLYTSRNPMTRCVPMWRASMMPMTDVATHRYTGSAGQWIAEISRSIPTHGIDRPKRILADVAQHDHQEQQSKRSVISLICIPIVVYPRFGCCF
jgi:hypothetical protein